MLNVEHVARESSSPLVSAQSVRPLTVPNCNCTTPAGRRQTGSASVPPIMLGWNKPACESALPARKAGREIRGKWL